MMIVLPERVYRSEEGERHLGFRVERFLALGSTSTQPPGAESGGGRGQLAIEQSFNADQVKKIFFNDSFNYLKYGHVRYTRGG